MFSDQTHLNPDINSWKLIMPRKLRPQMLKENHDELQSGHLGSEKTHARISEYYYWPGLYSKVIKYVKNCKIYQRIKPSNQAKIGLMGKRLIEEPRAIVAADIMGPLPLSKKGEKFGIRHNKTPKYYSQANYIERYNRTIKKIIKARLENDYETCDDNVDDV